GTNASRTAAGRASGGRSNTRRPGGGHEGRWRRAFFFSSRRRHTRWPRDWSSDVCSSDLDTGGTADAGSGVATFRIDQHVDLSPTECRIRRVEASTLFPIPSGPDPALDPVQSGTFSETDQTFSPGSCFGGPNVSANSSKTLRLVFGSTFASGSTSVTFFDGSIILVRSGYGLFNASASLEIMSADGSAVA